MISPPAGARSATTDRTASTEPGPPESGLVPSTEATLDNGVTPAPPAAKPGGAWDIVAPGDGARQLAAALRVPLSIAEILVRRGHDATSAPGFLTPRLAGLTAPDAMADRDAAAARLAAAVREKETVCVFGDYDCDGITSTAIMTEGLRLLGATVVPLLASRFEGGYGVSPEAGARIRASGATLLVTCDCGSSDHATLRPLADAGLEIVVIDHHLVPDEPLPAVAFLNPHRPECAFPYKGLASCGLALSIMAALRTLLGVELDVRRWLDLVAIGTIADVAPLDGDNRALVRAGLQHLRRGERPGVRALMELAKMDAATPVTGQDVAFRLAPRINAPGRLGSPDVALELLLAADDTAARALAARVEQLTLDRRARQATIIAEAEAELAAEVPADGAEGRRTAIVVGRRGWNHGIVGIVAGRLAEAHGCPVVVVGFDETGLGRGSVRGPTGSRLHDALSRCEAHLVRFGGHQAAAGVTLQEAALPAFRTAFEAACADLAASIPAEAAEVAVDLGADDPMLVVRGLDALEPCGKDNPLPRFAVHARVVRAREVRGGHLKLELALDGGRHLSAFGIQLGSEAARLSAGSDVRATVIGSLKRDTYRGGGAVEVRIDAIL